MNKLNQNDPSQDIASVNKLRLSSKNALYENAIALIAQKQAASTSFLQHHLDISYTEATTLIERLENDGLIGKADGINKRSIYIDADSSVQEGSNYEN